MARQPEGIQDSPRQYPWNESCTGNHDRFRSASCYLALGNKREHNVNQVSRRKKAILDESGKPRVTNVLSTYENNWRELRAIGARKWGDTTREDAGSRATQKWK